MQRMSYNDWSLSYKKILATFPKLPSPALHSLPFAIGILSFLGFLDATYLTFLHYKNAIPPCGIHACEVVLTSQFSSIAGVPISLLGVLYYLTVLILVGILFTHSSENAVSNKQHELGKKENHNSLFILHYSNITTLLVLLTGLGLIIGVFLVILQAFVLHAFCQYCLASELIDFLLFDCAWWLWRKSER